MQRPTERKVNKPWHFLKAAKLEDNSDSSQKLIASLNRGRLWSLTLPAQKIVVKLESLFRQLTPNVNLQGINLSCMTLWFNGSMMKYPYPL